MLEYQYYLDNGNSTPATSHQQSYCYNVLGRRIVWNSEGQETFPLQLVLPRLGIELAQSSLGFLSGLDKNWAELIRLQSVFRTVMGGLVEQTHY